MLVNKFMESAVSIVWANLFLINYDEYSGPHVKDQKEGKDGELHLHSFSHFEDEATTIAVEACSGLS